MFTTIKKICASFVATAIVLCSSVQVSAEGTKVEKNKQSILKEYMSFCIPRHLYAQRIDCKGNVSYSEPIPFYNFETGDVIGEEVFLINDNVIIGKMIITEDDNEYSSCFDTTISKEIVDAFQNRKRIAIGGYDNSIWLYTDNGGFSYIDGIIDKFDPCISSFELSTINIKGSTTGELDYNTLRSIADVQLDNPDNFHHVPNSFTYDSNGECWASCVAMLTNYQGLTSSLLADDVYEDLIENNISYSSNGTYAALTYYGYTFIETNSCMSPHNVSMQLVNDKPIIMHIKTSTNIKHAVVIKAMVLDYQSSTYTIDDPNYSSDQTIVQNTFALTASNTFTSYPSWGYNYTIWYNSYY